jgi:hypothetical protein
MGQARIVVSRKRIVHTLILVAVVLVALSLAGQVYRYTVGHDRYLVRLFDMDMEWNLPTVFNVFLLLLTGFLLSCIAWLEKNGGSRFKRRWWGLAGLVYLASLDELVSFHEQLSGPIRVLTGADGLFHYAWVIPAFILLAVLFVIYLPLFISFSSPFKIRFAAAAAVYLLGAVGLEMLGGKYLDGHETASLGYALVTNVEESLEWAGLLLAIDSLLLYLVKHFGASPIEVLLQPMKSPPGSRNTGPA